jgi:hypothetical protein
MRLMMASRLMVLAVDMASCRHVVFLTPAALLKLGLSPAAKVFDLKVPVRCRGCGARGRAVVSIKCGARTADPRSSLLPLVRG